MTAIRDKDIRGALLKDLRAKYCHDSNTVIVEEFGLCQGDARIDIAVINGAMYGFEIKSERDTLQRLTRQKSAYNEVFDYVTVVASTKHIQNIEGQVPEWWGLHEVQCASRDIKLIKRRLCRKNRNVNSQLLVQLLWREEAFEILKRLNVHRGLSGKPRRLLWARLAKALPLKELSAEVRSKIRQRQNWRSETKQESNDD
jgi:hypothetical protein